MVTVLNSSARPNLAGREGVKLQVFGKNPVLGKCSNITQCASYHGKTQINITGTSKQCTPHHYLISTEQNMTMWNGYYVTDRSTQHFNS